METIKFNWNATSPKILSFFLVKQLIFYRLNKICLMHSLKFWHRLLYFCDHIKHIMYIIPEH